MSLLWDVTHETGDLTQYDSTVTDGGDLSVTTAAKLAGTSYGLDLEIDDTNSIYGYKNWDGTSGDDFRCRYYIDPNSLTIPTAKLFTILFLDLSASPNAAGLMDLRYDGSHYELRAMAKEDGGAENYTSYYDITDEPHYTEYHLERAANSGSSDGQLRFWIDGALQQTISNLDNYDLWDLWDGVGIGAVFGIDAGTSGTFYIDEFKANDDGSEIGEYPVRKKGQILFF